VCQCGTPATFRCGGKACRSDKAWCDAHRRRHPRDPDVDYCPSCYEITFPSCDTRSCPDVGIVRCEHASPDFRRCGRRMCTRHASRWQVFGGERVGLGRCSHHSQVHALPPEEVLFQIITGASLRRNNERLPSLLGFAHNLRGVRKNDLALNFEWIYRTVTALIHRTRHDATVSAKTAEAKPLWDRQIGEIREAAVQGRRLVEQLRAFVPSALAATIEYADYRPESRRGGVHRRAMLFVKVPEHQRGLFIGSRGAGIKSYSERLGVDVKIEGGGRR
jgi:hypothetical protein